MGIELKVEVTPKDVEGSYTGERRKLYLTRIEDDKTGPQPNLIRSPLTLVVSPFGETGLFNGILNRWLGENGYNAFREALTSCVRTYNELFYDFLVGDLGEKEPHRLEGLAQQHHHELTVFARTYNMLPAITVDPKTIMKETTSDLDSWLLARKKDDGARLIESYWRLGIKGLVDVVLIANRLYGRGTMKEFLAHVDKGVIDHDYLDSLSRGYLPANTSPQTL